jgi:ribosomal protein S18 acetylase RimI-like enzyme
MATLTFIYKPTAFFGTTEDVVVDESFRGKGIARKLMNELIKKAQELGMKQIDLTSNPARESANKFYLSLNFNLRQTNCYRLTLS